jgi:hypothetical protein
MNSRLLAEMARRGEVFISLEMSEEDVLARMRDAYNLTCAGKATTSIPGNNSALWCYRCGEGTVAGMCRQEIKRPVNSQANITNHSEGNHGKNCERKEGR